MDDMWLSQAKNPGKQAVVGVFRGSEQGTLKARATGLEPATTGSTVRYSNQLSYAPKLL